MNRLPPSFTRIAPLLALLLLSALPAASRAAAPPPPLLQRSSPQAWTIHAEVFVQSLAALGTVNEHYATAFAFDQAAVVYPLIVNSASHDALLDKATSDLLLDEISFDTTPTMLTGYQCNEQMGRWDLPKARGQNVRLSIYIPMVCYETRLDEPQGVKIAWPKNDWAAVPASALQPQLFVESDDPDIQRLVSNWTKGRPKSVPPMLLAKSLAGQVVEYFQPNGQGVVPDRVGRFAGMDIHGAAAAAHDRQGSPYDMAALLCACYRAAGLPARLIVAFDIASSLGREAHIFAVPDNCGGDENGPPSNVPILRAWVEFYLLDEAHPRPPRHAGDPMCAVDDDDPGWWIPVDIFRMRGVSNRALPFDQPWPFFGTSSCTDNIAPLSYHFHPPTTVVNGGPPALWGWITTPIIPEVEQALLFDATQTVKRGGDAAP